MLVDRVIATVNDSAILWSALQTNTYGRLRTLQAQFGSLRPEDIERVNRQQLDQLIDRHTMAQAAKTFGIYTPEQVENILRRELERDEQQMIRDLGSQQAYTQALQNQGRTWQTFVSEQRVDKLAGFAEQFAVNMRLQQQENLYVTPRMLRETYQREQKYFVHDAEALVAMVVFRGADAMAHATAAAELWQQQEMTSGELASRFAEAGRIDDALASSLVPELAQWALAGPLGNVSTPVERNGVVQLAKVVDYRPARNGRFEDPDVQNELRRICRNSVIGEFQKQALERARQRTEVYRLQGSR